MRRADVIAVVAGLSSTGCHVDPPLPPLPSCSDVADHVYTLHHADGVHARAVRAMLEHRCEVDRWSERTRTCIAEEATLGATHKCHDTLTTPQRTQLDAALAALAMPVAPSSAPIADAECPPTAVEECAAVCDALGRVAQCHGMSPGALKEAWIRALAMWGTQSIDTQRRMCLAQLQTMQVAAQCGRP